MTNIVETESKLQIEVPLTEEGKLKYAHDLLESMTLISRAMSDMDDYKAEKKEEMAKYDSFIVGTRGKLDDKFISKETRITLTNEIIEALNSISEIEQDLRVYQTEKKAEIARCEATMSIAKSRLSRGKDFDWVNITIRKDFTKHVKTYIRTDTGELIKTLPLSNDDLQSSMDV